MDTNKIIRYGLLGGIFLVPFIPLIVAPSLFFPFVTGKNFAFRIITEIILALWLILLFKDASYRPKKSWLLWAITAFVSIIALADIFGDNFSKSFWSNYERMEGLITHLHLLAYFLVASSVLITEKLWARFFQTSLVVSLVMAGYGFLQLAGKIVINQGGVRIDATFGNAAYLAVYALFHIFLAWFLFTKEKSNFWLKALYVTAIAFNSIVLYYTATRGAILGLIAGAFLTLAIIAIFEKENKLAKKLSLTVIIAIIALFGIFLSVRKTNFVEKSQTLSRLASISLTETTTKARFLVWDMAIEGFKERPVLGYGGENFNLVFNKYYDPKMYNQEQWFDRAHNVFLDWLIAGGLLGILAYLSIFACAIHCLWRRMNISLISKSVLTGLFAGYFFHNLFVFDNIVSYIMFFSVLAYIHSQAGKSEPLPELTNKQVNNQTNLNNIYISLIIIGFVFVAYFVNWKGFMASRELIEAIRPQSAGLSSNFDHFKKSLAYNSFGVSEAREQLAQVSSQVAAMNAPEDIKQKFFEFGRDELIKQTNDFPNDARYELLLSVYLNKFKLYDEAIKHLEKAVNLSPKKQAIKFELTSSYISKKEYDKALATSKDTYELELAFADARDLYAVAAIYAGRNDIAQDILIPAYGTMAVPQDIFVNAYVSAGDYQTVVEIWQKRISDLNKIGEDNPQFHISLAAAYLKNGERQKAILELEQVIKLNPSFKNQGEYYINEIRAGRNP